MLSILVALAFHASAIDFSEGYQSGPPPAPEQTSPPAQDTADQSGAEPENGSSAEEPAPEEEVEQVCHRRTEYDMMGRPRSRRVCRPR